MKEKIKELIEKRKKRKEDNRDGDIFDEGLSGIRTGIGFCIKDLEQLLQDSEQSNEKLVDDIIWDVYEYIRKQLVSMADITYYVDIEKLTKKVKKKHLTKSPKQAEQSKEQVVENIDDKLKCAFCKYAERRGKYGGADVDDFIKYIKKYLFPKPPQE